MFDWIWERFEFLTRGKRTSELADWLGMPIEQLRATNLSYESFEIKKRSGKARQIDSPNPQLKFVQRVILRRLLSGLKVHEAAIGFEKGKSIVDAAKHHIGQEIVLSFDIVDFFPSISADRIHRYFRRIGWNYAVAKLLTSLVTFRGCLPQGAPTSPRLSNLVNYRMDCRLKNFVAQYDGAYTRYADDITVSFPFEPWENVHDIARTIRWIIHSCGYQPHLGNKLKIRRKNKRQTVNGLVVNQKVNLSRERRRWLRAVKHRARSHWNWTDGSNADEQSKMSSGKIPTLNKQEFLGWLAFERMIDQANADDQKQVDGNST